MMRERVFVFEVQAHAAAERHLEFLQIELHLLADRANGHVKGSGVENWIQQATQRADGEGAEGREQG